MFQYAVVEFLDSCSTKREVDIVCMSWLIGDGSRTLWPPKDVASKQKKSTEPGEDWKEYDIKIIDRAVDLKEARNMLRKSEFTSDVRSDVENQCNRKRRNIREENPSESDGSSTDSFSLCADARYETPRTIFPSKKARTSFLESTPINNTNLQPEYLSSRNCSQPVNSKASTSVDKRARVSNNISEQTSVSYEHSFSSSYEQNVTCIEFMAFQETFFKKLAEIKCIEEENNRLLKKIVFSECRPANEQDLPQDIPQLPLNSVSAVAELETWLSVEGNKQCLVNYLSIIGGKDIHDATRKIMAKIIGRELAVQYNWAGRGEKLPFSQLKLKDIVLGAVLKTSEEKEFSFTRISQDIKDWLKSAKYRTKSLAMNTAE